MIQGTVGQSASLQKIMEKDLMEAIFKHVKDNNMFGNRQHELTKGRYA